MRELASLSTFNTATIPVILPLIPAIRGTFLINRACQSGVVGLLMGRDTYWHVRMGVCFVCVLRFTHDNRPIERNTVYNPLYVLCGLRRTDTDLGLRNAKVKHSWQGIGAAFLV